MCLPKLVKRVLLILNYETFFFPHCVMFPAGIFEEEWTHVHLIFLVKNAVAKTVHKINILKGFFFLYGKTNSSFIIPKLLLQLFYSVA